MSRALKSLIVATAIGGMTAFVIAHAPVARAQDAAAAPADDLPPGPDHDLVKTSCTMCHQASNFDTLHQDAAGWTDTVTEMGAMGAVIPDENVPKIVAYLTAHFGPVGSTPAAPAATPTMPPAPDAATPAPADSTPPPTDSTPPPADDMNGPAQ